MAGEASSAEGYALASNGYFLNVVACGSGTFDELVGQSIAVGVGAEAGGYNYYVFHCEFELMQFVSVVGGKGCWELPTVCYSPRRIRVRATRWEPSLAGCWALARGWQCGL